MLVAARRPTDRFPVPITMSMRPSLPMSPIAGLDWKIWCWQRDHFTSGPCAVTRMRRRIPAQLQLPHGPPGLASPPMKMSMRPLCPTSYSAGDDQMRVERVHREAGQRVAVPVDHVEAVVPAAEHDVAPAVTVHVADRGRALITPLSPATIIVFTRHRTVPLRAEHDDTALLTAGLEAAGADDDLLAPVAVEIRDGRARLDRDRLARG